MTTMSWTFTTTGKTAENKQTHTKNELGAEIGAKLVLCL